MELYGKEYFLLRFSYYNLSLLLLRVMFGDTVVIVFRVSRGYMAIII